MLFRGGHVQRLLLLHSNDSSESWHFLGRDPEDVGRVSPLVRLYVSSPMDSLAPPRSHRKRTTHATGNSSSLHKDRHNLSYDAVLLSRSAHPGFSFPSSSSTHIMKLCLGYS
jgi:hypothetical protein